MCKGDRCEGCECEGCECSNGFLYACVCCCYATEPVAEIHSDVKQDKKKEEEAPAPPLVMLRPENKNGYQSM